MGDTSKYLAYAVNVKTRKNKYRWSYVSFGDICSKIEFRKACFGKLVISPSKVDILRIEFEDVEKTCWGWCG